MKLCLPSQHDPEADLRGELSTELPYSGVNGKSGFVTCVCFMMCYDVRACLEVCAGSKKKGSTSSLLPPPSESPGVSQGLSLYYSPIPNIPSDSGSCKQSGVYSQNRNVCEASGFTGLNQETSAPDAQRT